MKKKINISNKILLIIISVFMINLICCSKNDSSTNSNGSGSPGTNEVWMQSFAFNPVTKNITTGTKITWTNKDNATHTVTSGTPGNPDGIFNSGDLNNGGTFSFTFNTAGTFKYYCAHHSSMIGTIVVQ
jgi:plastocyanin